MTFILEMSRQISVDIHTHYTHITHSPVNADSTQVEDTGGAHHHIQRDKDVTVKPAEEPGPADHLQDRQEDYQRTCFSWTYSHLLSAQKNTPAHVTERQGRRKTVGL